MPDPARILLIRSRQVTPPAFGFQLVTGPSALPCKLLALGIPEFGGLGDQSRFSGTFWANQTPHGWEGEITEARLSSVDLGSLVGRHSPHALRATGDIAINRARFRDGRIEEAEGGLATGPGAISCSLIEAAELGLGLESHVDVTAHAPTQLAGYEQLAFRFWLDWWGIVLEGCCEDTVPGTVLVERRGPMLTQVSSEPRPVASLIRMLVPGDTLQVPATRQADRLVRLLPLPQSASAGVRVGTSP